ncbi:MAG: hypothetical protein PUH03_06945 [bacterium]|nr:hypothetical protein [bacterium]MDY2829738.1 hypothetical protein [Alphaproteobacteria bacterium]
MKRFILFLVFACLFSLNVKAGIYHGIDIDNVFEKSDWSNKEKIKEVIDDYALLLQYQKEYDSCLNSVDADISCYDAVAVKILTTLYFKSNSQLEVFDQYNLYSMSDDNLEIYKKYKEGLKNAFMVLECRNKIQGGGGEECFFSVDSGVKKHLSLYIKGLLDASSRCFLEFYPMLKDYK